MNSNYLSCNGLGLSPSQMISVLLNSYTKLPGWFKFEDRDIIFTYQGRCAIALACRIWNIGSGDEVLVPAYNCGAEIDPFTWFGAKAVFYRVDNNAVIDVKDIVRRVTSVTKMIFITHFFGWPQDTTELVGLCKKKGICLIEDCAQSLFSKGPNNSIGRLGDAVIFSFVKSAPVPDGGALLLHKNSWAENRIIRAPRYHNIFLASLPLLKKWFMNTNDLWQHHRFSRKLLSKSWLKKPIGEASVIRREMPKSNYFDKQKIDWPISRMSKGILYRLNSKIIFEIRRRNYQYLKESLINIAAIRLLYKDLPDGVCPLSFPILVKDRNRWCQALEDCGILVGGWPSYHRRFSWAEFPEAQNLKDNLLTLPIHQDLGLHQMEYIARCVKLIGRRHKEKTEV